MNTDPSTTNKHPTLVLASTSRYRKAILDKLDIPFETASPDVDETVLAGESPLELVRRLSELKARAVANNYPGALVIGSDQVAVLDEQILGKPGNFERAKQQLRKLSGNLVIFHTGLCLLNTTTDNAQLSVIDYEVKFRKLSDQEIEAYLKKEQPYDSAGSFKSEGLGIILFEYIRGDDPNTLIGLPLIELCKMLTHERFSVL